MTYVVWMFLLVGCWLAVQRSVASGRPLRLQQSWVVAAPAVLALLGCLVFTGSNGEGLSWSSLPEVFFLLPVLLPLLLISNGERREQPETWSYHGLTPAPFDVVFTLVVYGMTADVWIAIAALSLIHI